MAQWVMANVLRIARLTILAAAALAGYPGAGAATLYKSVDKEGHVTFSDTPVDGAVKIQRMETSDSAKPAESGSAPMYLALADSFDAAVTQANEKLDLAEHALAVARRTVVEHDPLSLRAPRLSRADLQQLDFYKNDVTAARKNLLRILKQRNTLLAFRENPVA
jgi:hypothetical protein